MVILHPTNQCNDSFCSKIESVQYNAALAIAGAIQGTSQTTLYRKLGLESLRSRQWFRHLCKVHYIKLREQVWQWHIFLLHCHHYHNIRAKLLNSLEVIDTNLLKFSKYN